MDSEQEIVKRRRGRPRGSVKNRFLSEDLRVCSRCVQPKPLTDFSTDRSRSDGLSLRCSGCRRLKNKYVPCGRCGGLRYGETPGLCRSCYTNGKLPLNYPELRQIIETESSEPRTLESLIKPPKLHGKNCERCGEWFTFQGNAKKRKVCGPECARAMGRELAQGKSLLPYDFNVLYDLYWNQGLSTNQIAERYGLASTGRARGGANVHTRLKALGIPTRKKGVRAQLSECVIEGCRAPVYKVLHKQNGYYGRRCLEHWVAHRQKLSSDYWFNTVKWRKLGLGETAKPESLSEQIERAVPRTLPVETRNEVCQELALRILTREISLAQLSNAVRECTKRFYSNYQSRYGPVSLDTPLYNKDGITLGETLVG